MSIMFYPHIDDTNNGAIKDRLEVISEAAERFKAAVLDVGSKGIGEVKIAHAPKDLTICYNWEEIAIILREIREMPESDRDDRQKKATFLLRLAEIYEVLRAAKMSKLEAVRLALVNEANQLRGGSASPSQVA